LARSTAPLSYGAWASARAAVDLLSTFKIRVQISSFIRFQGQRPAFIPAQRNALGFPHPHRGGLKARFIPRTLVKAFNVGD
jgi:hypothetical protein